MNEQMNGITNGTAGDKVLIADDEPNIVVSLEFMMKREGFHVLVARDGLGALETIRREHPRLVLVLVRVAVIMMRERGMVVGQPLPLGEPHSIVKPGDPRGVAYFAG